jgi:hypothetical protein
MGFRLVTFHLLRRLRLCGCYKALINRMLKLECPPSWSKLEWYIKTGQLVMSDLLHRKLPTI